MVKGFIQGLALFGFMALLLFVPAGTWRWPQAWEFLILFTACSQATGLWLMRANPALLAERMKSPVSQNQTPRDRLIMVLIALSFAAWLPVMALDAQRFGWTATPPWLQAIGAALILAAFWGWVEVLHANSFAATSIRVQEERGQTVISAGPYAVVRHPMYAFALFLMIGTPLLLGSLWGLLWLVLILPLLGARALGEEAVLREGLAGYPEYAARVRFRLIPGVW